MTVANTILEQLGGSKFLAMTGAKNLLADGNTLLMTLPKIAAVQTACTSRLTMTIPIQCTFSVLLPENSTAKPLHGLKIKQKKSAR